MVATFVRLKLTLLKNGFRGRPGRIVGLVVGALFAVPMVVLGFIALASVRGHDDAERLAAVLGFSAIFLGWLVFPLMAFGTDETLDPSRLALLPLTRRQLMTGLVAASAVGVPAVATALVLLGSFIGYGRSAAALLIVAVAIGLEFALCIAGCRALTTALSRALRSRRGRDIAALIAPLLALVFQLPRFLFDGEGGTFDTDALLRPVGVLRWLPPGAAGQAMVDGAHGRLGAALAELALAAVAVVLLMRWWASSLERADTMAEASVSGRLERGADLFRGLMSWLPRTRSGAVAAKDLRYAWRDPRQRAALVSSVVPALIAPISIAAQGGGNTAEITLIGPLAGMLFGMSTVNMFGADGQALWINVASGNDPRSDLVGKNLASGTLLALVITLISVGLAALAGDPSMLPLALLLATAVIGVALGVGNVASARAPSALPTGSSNMFGSSSGQGCAAALTSVGMLLVETAILAPIGGLVIFGLTTWRPLLTVAAIAAPLYGYAVWRIGLRIASDYLWWRLPELLDAVSPKRA